MFNIPVISHNARLTSGSSGMMHLNALNGSSWWRPSDDNNSLTSCPPSYEEAVNNGPSFGLFNVNGGETTTHLHQTQHHHCHNQQNNNHLHFPQSHHRPNNRSGRPTRSVSSHSVSSHDQNGSDNNKTSSSGEVRLPSCDDNTAERLDRQEPQCERFSRISIVSSSSGNSAPSVPKSPRLDPRTAENKHAVKSEGKGGSGSAGWRKHLTVERSPLTSAKDRLYRVFSPMLSRKNDRSTEQSSKGSHGKAPLSPKARDESSEANEETSHPVRVRIASGRGGSARADRTDDVRSSGGGGKQHNVKSHHDRHNNAK